MEFDNPSLIYQCFLAQIYGLKQDWSLQDDNCQKTFMKKYSFISVDKGGSLIYKEKSK